MQFCDCIVKLRRKTDGRRTENGWKTDEKRTGTFDALLFLIVKFSF